MRKLLLILIMALFTLTACEVFSANNASTEALELEQNYAVLLSNGSMSLSYPATWFIAGEFPDLGVRIGTSESLVNLPFEGTINSGEVYIDIVFVRESNLEQDSPQALLQSLIDSVENPQGTVSEIETLTINNKAAAFIILDSADSSDGIQLVIDSGDMYSIILVAVANGEIERSQATVEAIAGSIVYTINDAVEASAEAEMTAEATEASE